MGSMCIQFKTLSKQAIEINFRKSFLATCIFEPTNQESLLLRVQNYFFNARRISNYKGKVTNVDLQIRKKCFKG